MEFDKWVIGLNFAEYMYSVMILGYDRASKLSECLIDLLLYLMLE